MLVKQITHISSSSLALRQVMMYGNIMAAIFLASNAFLSLEFLFVILGEICSMWKSFWAE